MTEAATQSDVGQRLRRLFVWPATVLVIGAHVLWGHDSYTPLSLILAGMIGCVVSVSVAYARPHVLPVAPILLLYYYLAMARPTFAAPFIKGLSGPIPLSSQSYELALVGAVLFAGVLLGASRLTHELGYRLAGPMSRLLDPPAQYGDGHTMAARISACLSLVFFVIVNFKATLIPTSLYLAANLFASPAIPLGLLFWDAHKTGRFSAKLLFWLVVAFTSLLGMSNGTLGAGVVNVLIAASLVWTVTGRVPVALMVVGASVFLILNPAKIYYRSQTWYQERDIGVQERMEAWANALTYTYSTNTDAALDASVESTAYRTTTLPFVALVFEMVPNMVPHEGPTRWLELPISFIPRVLWPGKPSHTDLFNNDFTLKFGLQSNAGVLTTTLNLPSVGDGYWRLGWAGIVIEGLLLGMLIGLFQGATRRESRAMLVLGVGFAVSTQADKHVFHSLASFPQYLFATATILFAVRLLTLWFMRSSEAPNATPALSRNVGYAD